MKTLFGMTAAVLMVVMMLFVSVPGRAAAAEKVTVAEMVTIQKAANEAAAKAKAQLEKVEEKRLAKELVKQAGSNAEVAGELLEAVKAGEEVGREEADTCAAIAKAVPEAIEALAAGDTGKAGDVLDRIAELESTLPTTKNTTEEHLKNITYTASGTSWKCWYTCGHVVDITGVTLTKDIPYRCPVEIVSPSSPHDGTLSYCLLIE